VDQQSVLPRSHHRKRGMRAVERTVEIGVEHRLDALGIELGPAAFLHIRAGIVHQDVQPVELRHDRRGDLQRDILPAEVAGEHQDLALLLPDLVGDRLERLAPPAGQCDSCPLARQRQRRRLADAAAGAGHPGDFSRQIGHS
jgi:hypothetical protein